MFTVEKEQIGILEKYILKNTKTGEYFSVFPGFGANVSEIVLSQNNELFSILDGEISSEKILENQWFKGAKLLPFANRIEDGKYRFENKEYQLFKNQSAEGHAIHGLVYNKKFRVANTIQSDENASIELEYNYDGLIDGYPFKFIVKICLSIDNKGFKYKTTVKNTGNGNMPFADGWHPYFTLNEKANNLFLRIPKSKRIVVDNRMIPTNELVDDMRFVELSKINESMLDTGFVMDGNSDNAITQLYSPSKKLSIILEQETGNNKYNFLQVFIPPSRQSVALEPMTSCTNAFNNDNGLIVLKPDEVFNASYTVYLS